MLGFVVSLPTHTVTVDGTRGRGAMAWRRASGRAAQGHSIVEFALILPLLSFMLLAAVDFARISSVQQRLEHGAHMATLMLLKDPSYDVPATLSQYIQAQANLTGPVTATVGYQADADGNDQAVVTAAYDYSLLLPGVERLRLGALVNGMLHISVRAAGVAATDPPTMTVATGGTTTFTVKPASNTATPAGLASLNCTLAGSGVGAGLQPCSSSAPATFALSGAPATGSVYTATVLQADNVASPAITCTYGTGPVQC